MKRSCRSPTTAYTRLRPRASNAEQVSPQHNTIEQNTEYKHPKGGPDSASGSQDFYTWRRVEKCSGSIGFDIENTRSHIRSEFLSKIASSCGSKQNLLKTESVLLLRIRYSPMSRGNLSTPVTREKGKGRRFRHVPDQGVVRPWPTWRIFDTPNLHSFDVWNIVMSIDATDSLPPRPSGTRSID